MDFSGHTMTSLGEVKTGCHYYMEHKDMSVRPTLIKQGDV